MKEYLKKFNIDHEDYYYEMKEYLKKFNVSFDDSDKIQNGGKNEE